MTVPRLLDGVDRSYPVFGKNFFSISTSSTLASVIQVNPFSSLFGSRLNALAELYDEFKFTDIEIRFHPTDTAHTGGYAFGYYKTNVPTLPTTTLNDIMQGTSSRFFSDSTTVPTVLRLGRAELLQGIQPWYKCIPTTTVGETSQGSFVFQIAGSGPQSITIEFGYKIVFRGATSPAVE